MTKCFLSLGIAVVVLAGGLVLSAQASSPPPITSAQKALGKAVLENQCAKCHRAPRVTKYSAPVWQFHLDTMGPKSKLSSQEAEALSRYIFNELYLNNPTAMP